MGSDSEVMKFPEELSGVLPEMVCASRLWSGPGFIPNPVIHLL